MPLLKVITRLKWRLIVDRQCRLTRLGGVWDYEAVVAEEYNSISVDWKLLECVLFL